MSKVSVKTYSPKADRWAVGMSFLCLMHCLMTPVLLLVFPALQISESVLHFHELTFAVLLLIAGIAFYRGYILHRKLKVLAVATAGFSFLVLGLLFHEYTLIVTSVGSLLLIFAHLWNMQFCRCVCCDESQSTF